MKFLVSFQAKNDFKILITFLYWFIIILLLYYIREGYSLSLSFSDLKWFWGWLCVPKDFLTRANRGLLISTEVLPLSRSRFYLPSSQRRIFETHFSLFIIYIWFSKGIFERFLFCILLAWFTVPFKLELFRGKRHFAVRYFSFPVLPTSYFYSWTWLHIFFAYAFRRRAENVAFSSPNAFLTSYWTVLSLL